jgi:hypothetical protein
LEHGEISGIDIVRAYVTELGGVLVRESERVHSGFRLSNNGAGAGRQGLRHHQKGSASGQREPEPLHSRCSNATSLRHIRLNACCPRNV